MGREVAIDASDMPAYANGQKYIYERWPGAAGMERP